jgi:endonuclease III
MSEDKRLRKLRKKLISMARKVYQGPWIVGKFSQNERANELINDIGESPHLFVLGCILGRRFHDERAWETLAHLEERVGSLEIKKLARLSPKDWENAFMKPTSLHRFHYASARNLWAALQRIQREYGGDASRIWGGSPSSATVVKRFLEFEGIGHKTATMAVNILARYFKIPLGDCFSIEVTVEAAMQRVLSRMGVVDSVKPKFIQLTMREMYPKYPGIFDPVLWEIGKFHCFPVKPDCPACPVRDLCRYGLASLEKTVATVGAA